MDKNSNNNNNSKNWEKNIQDLKMDINESNLELSNSIETFNNHMNKMDKYLNSKNNINSINNTNSNLNINIYENIKSSTESNIIDESSSLPIDINKYNIKPNIKKIADPSSDLLCQKLQQKIDTLTYDNFVLNKKNKDLASKNKELKMNLASVSHSKETELEIINEELNNLKNKLKRKDEDLIILKEKINKNNFDIKEYEKNKKYILEIKSENEKLINNNKKLNETIITIEQNLSFYKNKYNEIISKYDIIKKDKEHIDKELFHQKEKNKDLNSEIENLRNELMGLNEDKNKLIKKIKDNDIIKKKEYDDLINRTKERLEEKQKEDIERIKNDDTNIMKIKIKALEEQNDELKEKIKEMKENIKQKNNNDIIMEENKNQIVNLNDEISYLKLQIQLKDSEAKRLNRLYKENIDLIKQLDNENNSYKEKIKLLTDKINEMRTNSYEELNTIKNKLNSLNTENRLYEEQDNQFDKIFSSILLDIERNNNDEETKNMIITINELPKGNNKRISQFTLMANKLKKLSEQNALLSAKLQNIQIENEKYKEESNIYQNIAQNNNEPYEYLLKEIAKKDSELIYYKELMNEKEIRYKAVMKENERLNEKYNDIEKDLKQHLENRDKIEKLDYLVGKIVENQKKFLGGENFEKFDNNQLVNKKTYKVNKNDNIKKGKQKNFK